VTRRGDVARLSMTRRNTPWAGFTLPQRLEGQTSKTPDFLIRYRNEVPQMARKWH
jgi:hypothetical protein